MEFRILEQFLNQNCQGPNSFLETLHLMMAQERIQNSVHYMSVISPVPSQNKAKAFLEDYLVLLNQNSKLLKQF